MKFKERMYDNWQQPLDLARDKGLRRNELQWGRRVLIENAMLAKKMDSMLRTNFFVLMAPSLFLASIFHGV